MGVLEQMLPRLQATLGTGQEAGNLGFAPTVDQLEGKGNQQMAGTVTGWEIKVESGGPTSLQRRTEYKSACHSLFTMCCPLRLCKQRPKKLSVVSRIIPKCMSVSSSPMPVNVAWYVAKWRLRISD